jgi:hypothetical protein
LTKNWNREDQNWGYYDIAQIPYPPSLTTFDIFGVQPFDAARAYDVGDTVIYQTVVFQGLEPAYRISKLYECILPTTPGILPTNTTYWNDRGQSLATWQNNANVITTWEDNLQTLATWSYATRGYGNNVGRGTTFDSNSLLFTAPVDMYSSSSTTDFDKYLVFPRRNILE